jgi:hypothetical protein
MWGSRRKHFGKLGGIDQCSFYVDQYIGNPFFLSTEMTFFSFGIACHGNDDCFNRKKPKKDSHEAQNEMGTIFSIVDETLNLQKLLKFSMQKNNG